MTDKERLEEIKEKYNFGSIDRFVDVKLVNPQELKWLIQQAERVHGKNNLIGLAGMYEDCNRMVANLTSQNKRYREALEFYAGGKHVAYKLDETDDDLVVDYGEIARKALGSEENEMR